MLSFPVGWFLFVMGFSLVLLWVLLALSFFMVLGCADSSLKGVVESGFLSVGLSRAHISLSFFCAMVVFVLFDLELVLLIWSVVFDLSVFLLGFLCFVVLTLFLEWVAGGLLWGF